VLLERQHTVQFVLGLKGTMSEAELFVLRARLQGGILNKAKRGALKLVLPIGLCYTESQTIALDPNVQVQATIREVFHCFEQSSLCSRALFSATGRTSALARHHALR
jgi:DNA invertase Pin-like site-specific DNA recombinase